MVYTIYKTTNLLNGKFYIGKHQTENPYDTYLGSGKAIREAIRIHGSENFKKDVLYIFGTEEEMNCKEKEILTEEFISTSSNYNEAVGGEGGPHFKGRKHSEETKRRIAEKVSSIPVSLETRQKISAANKERKTSPETREKLAEKARKRFLNISPEKLREFSERVSDGMKKHRGIEEFGRPRQAHNLEIAGSNPAPAT